MTTWKDLVGTTWKGTCELWLDPMGDQGTTSECVVFVDEAAVRYTWSHEGKAHEGRLALKDGGADFTDSWHQPEAMDCTAVAFSWALLSVVGRYGDAKDWGWRTTLAYRAPMHQLVLQMTNIAPWGEEARAVRMVCDRA